MTYTVCSTETMNIMASRFVVNVQNGRRYFISGDNYVAEHKAMNV